MTKEEGSSSMKPRQSSMTANSMKLISAGTLVQVLAFILLPVIGRIYTESEMGQITVFLSVVGVLTIVATGRYDQATIFARSKERALLLLFTSLRFNLIFCLALDSQSFFGGFTLQRTANSYIPASSLCILCCRCNIPVVMGQFAQPIWPHEYRTDQSRTGQ